MCPTESGEYREPREAKAPMKVSLTTSYGGLRHETNAWSAHVA